MHVVIHRELPTSPSEIREGDLVTDDLTDEQLAGLYFRTLDMVR